MENHFLDNIKRLRNEKGISQKEMANRLGFAQSNYNKIEKGIVELTVNRLYEIAEILGVSIFQILLENPSNSIEQTIVGEIQKNKEREFLEKMSEEIKAKAKKEFEKEMDEQIGIFFESLKDGFKNIGESMGLKNGNKFTGLKKSQ